MNSECLRIADQLRRAFEGKAWHGDSLTELLAGVTPEQAHAHPVPNGHSIWELVLHIQVWTQAGRDAVKGVTLPESLPPEEDWPKPLELHGGKDKSADEKLWSEAVQRLFRTSQLLREDLETFSDDKLDNIVPGRKYNYYFLFHGIVQHSLYHAGQMALLKKLPRPSYPPLAKQA